MKYESLIFDIDGTLWDSTALVAEGYNLQLRDEGLDRYCVDAARLKTLFGKVMTDIADAIFPDMTAEERYPLMERCMARENDYLAENECRIGYPGVREALEKLAGKHQLFIVSNSQCGYPQLCIDKLGLGDLITGHLCFGDTLTTKGETIRTLMAKYNIRSAAYVGDTEGDHRSSVEAGIPFIWASYGFDTPTGWDARIDNICDLVRMDMEEQL